MTYHSSDMEDILCPYCKTTYKHLCFHYTCPDEPDAPIFVRVTGCAKGVKEYETYTGCSEFRRMRLR